MLVRGRNASSHVYLVCAIFLGPGTVCSWVQNGKQKLGVAVLAWNPGLKMRKIRDQPGLHDEMSKQREEARERGQQLRALIALSEDLGLVPSTLVVVHSHQ